MSPPVPPGATMDVVVHGRGFLDTATVTITDPEVTLESATFRSWAAIDARVTVAPDATPGVREGVVLVSNADGSTSAGDLAIGTFHIGHIDVDDAVEQFQGFRAVVAAAVVDNRQMQPLLGGKCNRLDGLGDDMAA